MFRENLLMFGRLKKTQDNLSSVNKSNFRMLNLFNFTLRLHVLIFCLKKSPYFWHHCTAMFVNDGSKLHK